MNGLLYTRIVVPLTSQPKGYPHRVPVAFAGVTGEFLTDHIRSVDKSRLVRRVGMLDRRTAEKLAAKLVEMFEFR
ncbi:type II toxin-antitoxin system PemK/MazF family toxin [Chelatococcus sp. SYSU_G07232]|uniref:Type II toxin-antitoxin system PemK/MazF family toxin n=2 Tax=Chelatococcus albus TaxID=3047466 RepID=A0ABT7AEU5_9HYPH|nr:type II toxin-antitoxin system PemK/MazF family toxin [Chelatococcus sp. SYSU_G07232]MDJ1157876.1 type II toxin-antitoxin system PemK/MazF family toxin [Chelatococcus sp. SYSU_G07232]